MGLTSVLGEKIARFLAGVLMSFGAFLLGVWHGRKLAAQGITGENYYERNQMDGRAVARLLAIGGGISVTLFVLAKYTMALEYILPYSSQLSMVALRSVLVFMLAFQWQIWQDRTRLQRALPVVILALIVFAVVEFLTLIPSTLIVTNEVARDGVVMQTTGTTCGPCSLANILRVYGRRVTEADVTMAMGTGMTGAFGAEMESGARAMGFPQAVSWRGTFEEVKKQNQPMIVNIMLPSGVQHAVALVGISRASVTIIDSIGGITQYTLAEFEKIWRHDGVLLGTPSFQFPVPVTLRTFDYETFKTTSLGLEPEKGTPNQTGTVTGQ